MHMIGLIAILGAAMTLSALPSATGRMIIKEEHDAHIIIELSDESDSISVRRRQQMRLIDDLHEYVTPSFDVMNRYVHAINGLSVAVNASHVTSIRNLPGVKNVTYDEVHALRTSDVRRPLGEEGATAPTGPIDNTNFSALTMNKPEGTKEGEGVLIAVLDDSFILEHEVFTDLAASVSVKVQKEDLLPIIRSDDFHGHPGLKADESTYHNRKVPFYYDYGGLSHKPGEAGEPDHDVSSPGSDHGTHVASIAAASGPYHGIAPKAQLALMKVFTEYIPTPEDKKEGYAASSGAYESAILLALEDALLLKVDVINMSFGMDLNDFEKDSPVVKTLAKIKDGGIFTSVAAGNSGKDMYQKTGPYKVWTTDAVETGIMSTYTNIDSALTIGASQPDKKFFEKALLINDVTIAYEDNVTNYKTVDGDVVFEPERHLSDLIAGDIHDFGWIKIPGWGEGKDYAGLDIAGKIAIVDRGETTFTSKTQTAEARGAIALIIIDNDPSQTDFTFRMDFGGYSPQIPVISILYRDRETIVGTKGDKTSGTLKVLSNEVASNPTSRMMADFSSNGATYDLGLKPDLTTPGDVIRGGVGKTNEDGTQITDAYDYYGGTSMAAPNAAGAIALLLSEHLGDEAWRSSLSMRLLSSASVMIDVNDPSRERIASVRQQGAGLLDIKATLDNDVYLEGLIKTDKGLLPTKKAKIELRNGDDIAQGKIDLDLLAHSNALEDINYTVTTTVYSPATEQLDEERYPEYKGIDFQSTADEKLATWTESITVKPGETEISISHELSAETKAALTKTYANGNYLEGYVEFKAEGRKSISVPWLGFYGDYYKEEPIEPFIFEREENKVYGSDLVNSLCKIIQGTAKADFRSLWVQGGFDKFIYNKETKDIENKFDIMPLLLNKLGMLEMVDDQRKTVVPVGSNPVTGELLPDNESHDIYVGSPEASNMMLLQQFVNRSVIDNRITISKKSSRGTSKAVVEDAMIDPFFGGVETVDEHGKTVETCPLAKSMVSGDLIGSSIVAHRAIGLIPLYDILTGRPLADGEYTMTFEYWLAAAPKRKPFTKTYTLHIDSKAPVIKHTELIGDDVLRIRYEDTEVAYITANGHVIEIQKDEKGCYADVSKDILGSKPKLKVKTTDYAGNVITSLIGWEEDGDRVGFDSSLGNNKKIADYKIETTKVSDDVDIIKISASDKNEKPIVITGDITLSLNYADRLEGKTAVVKAIMDDGKEKKIACTIEDGYITFTTPTPTVKITLMKESTPIVDDDVSASDDDGSLPGWAIALLTCGSIVIAAGIAAAIAVPLVLKKKKNKAS